MKFHFPKTNPKGPFEGLPLNDWKDWQWQLRNSLKTQESFLKIYDLTSDEIKGFESTKEKFQIRSTPYYATLGSKSNPECPIRRIQTPDFKEFESKFQEMKDPLGEDRHSVTPRLIHRYPDRVLFLITDFCSVYCRFCTRKRFTGNDQSFLSELDLAKSLEYIRSNVNLREVILSGGDPLTVSDERLALVLSELRAIPHIEVIRIGSRMPVVNPFRITDSLVQVIKKYHPIFFMTHFNHPKEITAEAAEALQKLVDNGIPVFNQMVLLNGINNHSVIVQALSRRLLYLRVKPYYMLQCDPSIGTDHMRTSIDDSLEIQKALWGKLSGLAMPNLIVDIPHGGGKAGMTPNYLKSINANTWAFRGFDGVEADYINPTPNHILKPDISDYISEWKF